MQFIWCDATNQSAAAQAWDVRGTVQSVSVGGGWKRTWATVKRKRLKRGRGGGGPRTRGFSSTAPEIVLALVRQYQYLLLVARTSGDWWPHSSVTVLVVLVLVLVLVLSLALLILWSSLSSRCHTSLSSLTSVTSLCHKLLLVQY
jgi:hypothetical protein